jgi:flagellar export protein FliJ
VTRFQFRLQPVLDLRAAQLDTEEMRLRQLLELRARLDRAIADTEAVRQAEEEKVRGGPVMGAELWALAAWREAARETAARLAAERRKQDGEIAAQRERIAAARRRCRLLERLRERRLTEWDAENQRRLEEFAAEAYLARWQAR